MWGGDSYLGSIYCYLQSPLGQFLIKKNQTGSVVRHIYEADVSSLPIPRLPKRLRQELTDLVKKASAFRVEANRLLDEAESLDPDAVDRLEALIRARRAERGG